MRRIGYLVVSLAACWTAAPANAQWPAGPPVPAPYATTTTPNSPYDELTFFSSSPYPTTSLPELRISALDSPDGWDSMPTPATARELGLGEYWEGAEEVPAPAGHDQEEVLDDLVVDEPVGWYRPTYWFGPTPWKSSVELGLNGSAGNNEALSIQVGGHVKRKSRLSKLDLSLDYNRTTTGGESTQNNAQFDARHDWLLDDRLPWSLFGSGELFYDQFQSFDLQVNSNAGVGYEIVDDAELTLIGRLGGGTSREFGGLDDTWVPEGLAGFEYSQQLSNTQKFSGKLDYYPAIEEFGEFRYEAKVGWEIELVQPSNLSLKISVADRYDSTPSGVNPHLVNYSVLLLLKL
jgi:putative salt-induced outer membrane protein YdiY